MLNRGLNHLTSIDRSRYSEWAARACLVLLAALAIWLLVRLVWAVVPRGDVVADVVPARLATTSTSEASVSVAKWHLFGNSATPASAMRNAPATTLALTLRGTVADRNAKTGVAVISDAQGRERTYRVGDEIEKGATLDAVYPNHVVLTRDGAQESLQLPVDRIGAMTGATDRADSIATTASGNGGTSGVTPIQNSAGSATPMFVAPAAMNGAVDWQKTMNQVRENPAQLSQYAQPVLQDGRVLGVRVRNLDAATMARIGLQDGDMVTAVNGIPVDSPSRAAQIMATLKDANSVKVTVLRGGKATELNVGIRN
ncbi:MAG: type II secretion system protein GspC [Dokdonella sp.]